MAKLHIKKGDTVVVLSGDDKGVQGEVIATSVGGGIVGYNYNVKDITTGAQSFVAHVEECYNKGKVKVGSVGGGIVGQNGSNGSDITGGYANAGVYSCYNVGAVIGDVIGGIVGNNYGYYVTNAENPLDNSRDTDGVRGCYNAGLLSSVDFGEAQAKRVYLDVSQNNWVENDGAVLYLYYWWSPSETNNGWPGTPMTKVESEDATYYYADITVNLSELTGVIVNRCSPEGNVWNQSSDFKMAFKGDSLVLILESDAEKTDSGDRLKIRVPVVGGVAAYNNIINDCYYLANAVVVGAGISNGVGQSNIVQINGNKVPDSAVAKDASGIAGLTAVLNGAVGATDIWVDGENYPVFQWQE